MVKAQNPIVNFNGGEISPLLDARIDTELYNSSCQTLQNAIALPQGGATRRKGSIYVGRTQLQTQKPRLIPFIFSAIDSYVLEFGDFYVHFYTGDARVDVLGVPYEVVTPYDYDDLPDLKFVQDADVMYITHPDFAPRKLTRSGATSWAFTTLDYLNGPVLDENTTATTIQSNGVSGSVTLTASSAIFEAGHVGAVWALSEASGSLSAYAKWTASTVVIAAYYSVGDRLYLATGAGTTGTITPTHEYGTVSDGGVSWTFINKGTGYAKITGFTSSTVVTATVQTYLPPTVNSGGGIFTATPLWNEGAWSGVRGYPTAIAFYEQRLFLGGTSYQPQTIWGSKSNRRFENFDSGTALDDESITYTLVGNSGQVNTIQWLNAGKVLLAGTYGGSFALYGGGQGDPLTPSNITVSSNGAACSSVQPMLINNNLFFLHRSGKRVYQLQYDFNSDAYKASDVSIRAEHITGDGVDYFAQQQYPYNILWSVRSDGVLLGITLDDDNSVSAWHRHVTDGEIESICVIPTINNTEELWMVVKRTILGSSVRYIEYIDQASDNEIYADCALVYSGVSTSTVSVTHLGNEDVDILADGAVDVRQAVAGNTVTLSSPAIKVFVGLNYVTDISPMNIEQGGTNGAALCKKKRISNIVARFYNTLGAKYGRDENNMYTISFRTDGMGMDQSPTRFGYPRPDDQELVFNDDNSTISRVLIRQDQPLPMTLIAISPRVQTNEG